MVTTHRTSLSSHSVEMSAFISANRDFVDLTQCDKVDACKVGMNIPPHVL